MERIIMNEYSKYVDDFMSKNSNSMDISKLNNIRKKFGKEEIKISPKRKIPSLYYTFGLIFILSGLIFNFSRETHPIKLVSIKKETNTPDIIRKILSIDEQALYWTYAIYDFEKFKKTFSVNKNISLNQGSSKENLIAILPMVSAPTLEKIYVYDHEILNSIMDTKK